jgi:hypothetical protein
MPDNAGYFQAAYAAAAIVYLGYAASIWWRSNKVRARLARPTRGG